MPILTEPKTISIELTKEEKAEILKGVYAKLGPDARSKQIDGLYYDSLSKFAFARYMGEIISVGDVLKKSTRFPDFCFGDIKIQIRSVSPLRSHDPDLKQVVEDLNKDTNIFVLTSHPKSGSEVVLNGWTWASDLAKKTPARYASHLPLNYIMKCSELNPMEDLAIRLGVALSPKQDTTVASIKVKDSTPIEECIYVIKK